MKGKIASIFMADIAQGYHLYSNNLVASVEAVAAAKDQNDVDLHSLRVQTTSLILELSCSFLFHVPPEAHIPVKLCFHFH